MKNIRSIFTLFLGIGLLLFSEGIFASEYNTKGSIMAVDIMARTIQINETIYGLADNIIIYSPSNALLNQSVLAAGQTIECNIQNQSALGIENTDLPKKLVTKLRIMSGYNEKNALKH